MEWLAEQGLKSVMQPDILLKSSRIPPIIIQTPRPMHSDIAVSTAVESRIDEPDNDRSLLGVLRDLLDWVCESAIGEYWIPISIPVVSAVLSL